MLQTPNSPWHNIIRPPLPQRESKPRSTGLTMVIDKGMDLVTTEQWLALVADYVDFLKLGFGTSALYPANMLRRKLALVRSFGVHTCPGGTLLEIAVYQNAVDEFLIRARKLGFTYVEVSAGTLDISPQKRREIIGQALDQNLGVLTEVGKKDRKSAFDAELAATQIEADLAAGAFKVIVEARESGRGIGIYDSNGNICFDKVTSLLNQVSRPEDIMWEAPQASQQQKLLVHLGTGVNLGNVHPSDLLALETTRLGMRGDTFKLCVEEVNINAAVASVS